ncbi:MAG: PadR family transcriptional regulator [Acidimicrobiales bacterium]|nr:PadR family transcriptional regulator [Acidimicrobiales bacterium]
MAELTTTSYAILSLLGIRDWTTYQLAQQMDRSVGRMWPRAASVVYEEPKRLVRLGLAESRKEYTGKRASTVYSITADGRDALAAWLASPGAAPSVEFEALLKVAFADNGSVDALRANLAAVRAHAEAEVEYADQRRLEYHESGGPFPDRLPVIALAHRFFQEQNLALLRWVEWAETAVDEWSGVTPETGASVPPGAFER